MPQECMFKGPAHWLAGALREDIVDAPGQFPRLIAPAYPPSRLTNFIFDKHNNNQW